MAKSKSRRKPRPRTSAKPKPRTEAKPIAPKRTVNLAKLLTSVLVCEAVGVVGSLFVLITQPSWYNIIGESFFTPPALFFEPIWVVLYLLMGVAGYMIWTQAKVNKQARGALILFTLQLMLNFAWTATFFGKHMAFDGLVAVVLLWITLLGTMVWFWNFSKKAAALMFPYFAWVIFALILNIYIVLLNGM